MAISKSILKKTGQEVVIKVTGTAGDTTTLDIQSSDFLTASESTLGSTQKVNITAITFDGEPNAFFTIDRNSVRIFTLTGGNGGSHLNFDGQEMPPESTQNSSDLVVTFAGTGVSTVWLKMRKVSGYQSTIETAQFGSYDNESALGS